MAALTAHYVTHARFLWKWLRNPDNRRNKLPFRQKRWALLTGEEVCGQLRISLRTLQKLRDRGFIGYSQIGFRFYYKPEDVKRLIPLIGTICPTDR